MPIDGRQIELDAMQKRWSEVRDEELLAIAFARTDIGTAAQHAVYHEYVRRGLTPPTEPILDHTPVAPSAFNWGRPCSFDT